jgi:hypothetical protein
MEKKRSLEMLHTKHVKLWNWLIKYPSKQKGKWPWWKKEEGTISLMFLCFACEAAYEWGGQAQLYGMPHTVAQKCGMFSLTWCI